MSDSRLEKFIYAICSMDVSDLPVPLSRIEKLWNCLITGETPDFEPLSRNEKYLMAMLDRYDISNLPAPMSRGEKLLYKIAVGETDLSDVPGYLSRYEELLKYLIENGGISGGDFEYVLHTLNQSLSTLYLTAEKPVKSAILSGNTLVNLMTKCKDEYVVRYNDINNPNNTVANISMMKPNTEYTLFYKAKYRTEGDGAGTLGGLKVATSIEQGFFGTGQKYTTEYMKYVYKFTTSSVVDCFVFSSNGSYFAIKECVLLEGDYTQEDVPYFTGMQSVKMPVLTTAGKNLFDKTKVEVNKLIQSDGNITHTADYFCSDYIRINKNKSYYKNGRATSVAIYNQNKDFIKRLNAFVGLFTVTDNDCYYIRLNGHIDDLDILQLEEGTQATSYEPYKSNILSTSEDVTLRGVGNVKDTLNLTTGELTQRIGEVVYTEKESWYHYLANDFDNSALFSCTSLKIGDVSDSSMKTNFISDRFTPSIRIYQNDIIGSYTQNGSLFIRVKKEWLTTPDVYGLQRYLQQNPITVQYPLKEEVIKTVDLTVVDQDNQPTELGTFENVTHVSLVAENLIPEVEMEVATNLLEDTVFNLTNAFNTLYPTAAKPVKSAILKGQTLVNLASEKNTSIGGDDNITCVLPYNVDKITVYFLDPTYSKFQYFEYDSDGTYKQAITLNIPSDRVMFISLNSTTIGKIGYYNPNDINTSKNMVVMYGDTRDIKITKYFEGMQSVKMPVLTTTGKNLFDMSEIVMSDFEQNKYQSAYYGKEIQLQPNTTYTIKPYLISEITNTNVWTVFNLIVNGVKTEVVNANYTGSGADKKAWNTQTFETDETGVVGYSIYCHKNNEESWFGNLPIEVQLEEGSTATPYEPFKSNILTVNEEVELRGIGDVKDELNCLTGEVTESIGEIVLDGTQDMESDGYGVYIQVNDVKRFLDYTDKIACDKLPVIPTYWGLENVENGISGFANNSSYLGQNWLYVKINNSANTDEVKEWLTQNPITVQYQRVTDSIKTVDLTIINQDGNETKLGTFDDTTHVLLESEGLIPTASLTVRTKIPSGSSTSLLMDDISTNQQQLETTVDEQSNNVDATMIATTEIFEETL